MPRTNAGNRATTRPRSSMAAVTPVLVERTIHRPVSSDRICENCRCWSAASDSPNQASLLTFRRMPARGSWSINSSPKMSS
jgi:hypothetical protein